MPGKSIADVATRLEQIRQEMLATFTGLDRFGSEQQILYAGQQLSRRLALCIEDLKNIEKERQ